MVLKPSFKLSLLPMIFINRLKSTYNYGGPGLGDLIAGYGHDCVCDSAAFLRY